ncbi:MAG: mycothiol system anti-sigma-R factor [Marmoricola sp.]
MTESHGHDLDCSQVIHQIFTFIDREMDEADCAVVQKHLDECGPCLAKYDLERTVKSLVARSCSEQAPNELREKVLVRIRQVQITLTSESE